MNDHGRASSADSALGVAEVIALVFLGMSLVAWLLATPLLIRIIPVALNPNHGDAGIGIMVVSMGFMFLGATTFLTSVAVAVAARRLPFVVRILSVAPGVAAMILGHWLWKLA
jgi:hypothetical protein